MENWPHVFFNTRITCSLVRSHVDFVLQPILEIFEASLSLIELVVRINSQIRVEVLLHKFGLALFIVEVLKVLLFLDISSLERRFSLLGGTLLLGFCWGPRFDEFSDFELRFSLF